jgi:hypothetical protein
MNSSMKGAFPKKYVDILQSGIESFAKNDSISPIQQHELAAVCVCVLLS